VYPETGQNTRRNNPKYPTTFLRRVGIKTAGFVVLGLCLIWGGCFPLREGEDHQGVLPAPRSVGRVLASPGRGANEGGLGGGAWPPPAGLEAARCPRMSRAGVLEGQPHAAVGCFQIGYAACCVCVGMGIVDEGGWGKMISSSLP
jgi:hypothetical protein